MFKTEKLTSKITSNFSTLFFKIDSDVARSVLNTFTKLTRFFCKINEMICMFSIQSEFHSVSIKCVTVQGFSFCSASSISLIRSSFAFWTFASRPRMTILRPSVAFELPSTKNKSDYLKKLTTKPNEFTQFNDGSIDSNVNHSFKRN